MCTRRVARDANYASARICPVPSNGPPRRAIRATACRSRSAGRPTHRSAAPAAIPARTRRRRSLRAARSRSQAGRHAPAGRVERGHLDAVAQRLSCDPPPGRRRRHADRHTGGRRERCGDRPRRAGRRRGDHHGTQDVSGRSLILGAPAKVARELSEKEVASVADSAADYVKQSELYRSKLERIGRSRGAESLVRVQGTHVRGCNGFIGDRLARSVRGVACAPPKGSVARRRGH